MVLPKSPWIISNTLLTPQEKRGSSDVKMGLTHHQQSGCNKMATEWCKTNPWICKQSSLLTFSICNKSSVNLPEAHRSFPFKVTWILVRGRLRPNNYRDGFIIKIQTMLLLWETVREVRTIWWCFLTSTEVYKFTFF